MTLEARNHASRLTLDDLAGMLSQLGWPFDSASTPGEQLVKFFSTWIETANENSSDQQSFTPLFLAEMAAQQTPPMDLASGQADPTQVQLNLLELSLFTAALDRILILSQSSVLPLSSARQPGLSRLDLSRPLPGALLPK